MQLTPDWNRDAFTWGNFSPGGEMLESRRDSPQNTRVVVESIGFVDGEDNIETTLRIASLQSSC
jgi:hypothetical protein